MCRVLRKDDDTRRKPNPTTHKLAESFNRSLEAPLPARDLIVDGWVERVKGEMDEDAEANESVNEIIPQQRRVCENLAVPETDPPCVLEKPREVRVHSWLAPNELNTSTSDRSCFVQHAAPIGEFHPLGNGQTWPGTGVTVRAGEIAVSGDFEPEIAEAFQTTGSYAQLLVRNDDGARRQEGHSVSPFLSVCEGVSALRDVATVVC